MVTHDSSEIVGLFRPEKELFEVAAVVARRCHRGVSELWVRWAGCSEDMNSWEPEGSILSTAAEAVERFDEASAAGAVLHCDPMMHADESSDTDDFEDEESKEACVAAALPASDTRPSQPRRDGAGLRAAAGVSGHGDRAPQPLALPAVTVPAQPMAMPPTVLPGPAVPSAADWLLPHMQQAMNDFDNNPGIHPGNGAALQQWRMAAGVGTGLSDACLSLQAALPPSAAVIAPTQQPALTVVQANVQLQSRPQNPHSFIHMLQLSVRSRGGAVGEYDVPGSPRPRMSSQQKAQMQAKFAANCKPSLDDVSRLNTQVPHATLAGCPCRQHCCMTAWYVRWSRSCGIFTIPSLIAVPPSPPALQLRVAFGPRLFRPTTEQATSALAGTILTQNTSDIISSRAFRLPGPGGALTSNSSMLCHPG